MALRIIDLDIDENLSADTKVTEVGWVLQPAIETEMMYFSSNRMDASSLKKVREYVDNQMKIKEYEMESITDYPQYITDNAKKAKAWVDENGYGSCMTDVGKARLNQLANREPISFDTIKRMKAYADRHKKDLQSSKSFEDGCGYLAWYSWGLDTSGRAEKWLESKINSVEEKMAEVGPKGGIKESPKAPKSSTPNPNPKGEGSAKGDASTTRGAEVTKRVEETLQNKSDDFNEKYKKKLGYGVNLGMLKSVYQRGVGAYNVSHSPEVKSAEQWALARVNAFLYLVKNGRPENPKYDSDFDLLPEKHPKKSKKEDMDYDTGNLPDYVNYATGDTKNNMLIEPMLFVERKAGEPVKEYVNRCTEYLIKNEGKDPKQAYAICISKSEEMASYPWPQCISDQLDKGYDEETANKICGSIKAQHSEEFLRGDKVSFDYDDTLSTARGMGLALHEKFQGSTLYIISARNNPQGMYAAADKLGIPHSRVFATGSNQRKVQKIKDLGITRHYDNNQDVINQLGYKGIKFSCPCLDDVSMKGQEIFEIMDRYNLIGFIDDQPVFSTPDMAQEYATEIGGCTGYQTTQDENGNDVYLPCSIKTDKAEIKSIGQENINLYSEQFNVDEYSDEEKETVALLKFLSETDIEKFEAVVGSLRGATEKEVKLRNHKNPTTYFKYERVDSGAPDRDFCTSIENRYFRRLEIDLLRDTNTEFGHEKQPYSKWLYKGGPNCVHAWRKFLVQGNDFADMGMAEGKAGIPPKQMPNNGYYSPETKRKSEVAYIISQQNSKQVFKADNDQRMIYTPLMIPNILIPRIDEANNNERYYVRFKPEVIEKIRNKFMIEGRLRATNYEHTDHKFNDIVMVESWIVQGPNDKAYELGFTKEQVPVGTWMGGYKVLETPEGNTMWNDYIKTGKVRGASVEGEFLMHFSNKFKEHSLFGKIKTNKVFN